MHIRFGQEASGLGSTAGFTLDDLPRLHSRPSDSNNDHIPPLSAENLVVPNHVHWLVDLTSDSSDEDEDEFQDAETSSNGDQGLVHSVLDLTYDGITDDPVPRSPVPPSPPFEEQPKGNPNHPEENPRSTTASRILALPPPSPVLVQAQDSVQGACQSQENPCHAIAAQNHLDPPHHGAKPPPFEDTPPFVSLFGNPQDYTPIVNRHIATFVSLPPSLRVSYFAKLKNEPKFVQLPDHVRRFIYSKLLEMVEPQLEAAQAPLPSFQNPEDYTANVNSLIDTLVSLPPGLRVSYFAKVKKEPNFVQLPNHVRLFIYCKLMDMIESQPEAEQAPLPSFEDPKDYTPIVNRHIDTFASLPLNLRESYSAKLEKEPSFMQLPRHARLFVYSKLLEMVEPQPEAAQAPLPSFENPKDFTANVNSLIATFVSLPPSLRLSFFAKLKTEHNFVQLPNHVRLFICSKLMEMIESPSGAAQTPLPSFENPKDYTANVNCIIDTFAPLPLNLRESYSAKLKKEPSFVQLPRHVRLFVYSKLMEMTESQCAPAQAPISSFENTEDYNTNDNRLKDTFASLPPSLRVSLFAELKKEPNFVQLHPHAELSKLMEMVEFQSEPANKKTQMDLSEPSQSRSKQHQKDMKQSITEKDAGRKKNWYGRETLHSRLPTYSKFSMEMAELQTEQVPLKNRTQKNLPKPAQVPSVKQKDSKRLITEKEEGRKPMEMVEFQSEPAQAPVRTPTQMDLSEPEESPSIQQIDTAHPTTEKEGHLFGPSKKVYNNYQRIRFQPGRLPTDFEPGRYTVISGGKMENRNSVGNLHLKDVCRTFLKQYTQVPKGGKTKVIDDILQIIWVACPVGGFVRIHETRYWELGDRLARDKITCVMRELHPLLWRSTSKFKREDRMKKKMEKLKK